MPSDERTLPRLARLSSAVFLGSLLGGLGLSGAASADPSPDCFFLPVAPNAQMTKMSDDELAVGGVIASTGGNC